jgi:DNA-binding GntR family transcriptional regulator
MKKTSDAKQVQRPQSIPDFIAETLRGAIIRGEFEPGSPLRQDEIATKLKVSHTPVREALRQLVVEGLVKFYPNRGAVVTELSSEEVREIFDLRRLLEAEALRRALPNLTEVELQQAATILDLTEQETNLARWSELNQEFHSTLYIPARSPRLLSFIQVLHHNSERYIYLKLSTLNHQNRTLQEHRDILKACQRGDGDTAVVLLERHIQAAGEELVEYLSKDNMNDEVAQTETSSQRS